jgi:hypothetical protein
MTEAAEAAEMKDEALDPTRHLKCGKVAAWQKQDFGKRSCFCPEDKVGSSP